MKRRHINLAAIAAIAAVITAGTAASTLAATGPAPAAQHEVFVSSRGQIRVAGSAAIWYFGEGTFTISLSGGHAWPSPAPKGCRLSRDNEVIQCILLSKGGYYVPAEK